MFVLLVLLLASLLPAQPAADFAARAEAYIQSYVKDDSFRGSVSVVRDGQPVFRKSYGMANAEWDILNTPDTKFRIGSITKQFTAIAILQLAEAGKLRLDDPVSKHYDGAPAAWDKITIHHLLNHTSGIPSYTDLPDFFSKRAREPLTPAEVVRLTQDNPLQFEPGTQYKYNNTAYSLLGHIIEKLSGMKYDAYVRARILDPAGMEDSGYDWNPTVLKKRASGYGGDGKNAPFIDMIVPHAAGSLYSTVDDFTKWDKALREGKLVSGESWARMTTPGKSDYGYGLAIGKLAGRNAQSHGGGINGFNTQFIRFPDDRVAVVVFANKNGTAADTMANGLARMYFGEDVKPRGAYTEISMTAGQLEVYLGEYELSPQFKLAVRRTGAQLTVQATGQPEFPVFPYAQDKFFLKVVDAQLEFVRNVDGKIDNAILHQGGDRKARRIGDAPERPKPRFTEIAVAPAQLDAFTGTYELAPGFHLTVRKKENALFTQATGQTEFPVFAYAENKFFLKVVDAQLEFVRDAGGKVESAILHQNGRSVPAKRVAD